MKNKIVILFIFLLVLPFCFASNSTNTTNTSTNLENISEIVCDNFSIQVVEKIYTHEEKISYSFSGFSEGDNITYWIEDLFGEIWKNNYTSSNNNKKSYTAKIKEKDRVLILKAERSRKGCDISFAERKLIIIRKNNEEKEEENTSTKNKTISKEIVDEKIEENIKISYYDDEVQSGENIHVELEVQKNSNRNNAFYLWLENEKEEKNTEVKINLHEKGKYELEIEYPIQLEECGNAFQKNYLHFSGLGEEEEEKVYVLQEACPKIEEEDCAELIIENDIVLEENPISSLYVRAKKWQENISLYSKVEKETDTWIIGPVAKYKKLEAGTNNINISPHIGNNTFALLTEKGKGKIIHFYLEGEERKKKKIERVPAYSFTNNKTKKEENTTKNSISGEVIYTTKEKKNLPILGGIIIISSIGLLSQAYIQKKWKVLRSKNHSKEAWQTKSLTKKTLKKKSTKDIYT